MVNTTKEEAAAAIEIIDAVGEKEQEEVGDFGYSITSYGADYTVDSIAKRIEQGKIFVPPFQRKYVWTQIQASRFIESLILGLPVPGVFLAREEETGRLLIIDGQQRMLSIANFYKGVFGEKKFRLKGVHKDLEGKGLEDLGLLERIRLDDALLHATIVKQDSPSEDDGSIYMIFERLNTGGTPLQPQEIRACIYYGGFNELLSELIKNEQWRAIFGKPETRMKEEELVLRFFTLFYEYEGYKKVLKSYMNDFMKNNRNFEQYPAAELQRLFFNTIQAIHRAVGNHAFRIGNRINAAVYDSVMIGVAKRLNIAPAPAPEAIAQQYEWLLAQEDYRTFVESSTASESAVSGRIQKSIEAFKTV
jgi:hypothetical protein